MSIACRFASVAFAALFLLWFSPTAAAGQQVAMLRVESLDALGADLERIARLADPEFSREQVLGPAFEALGLTDYSWLQRSRPLGLLLPLQGLFLGSSALVGVFPVNDTDAALAALTARFDGVEVGDDGVHSLARESGEPVFVTVHQGHLVVGLNRQIVLGTVPDDVIKVTDLPPGNIVLDVDVQAIAPMAQMSLMAARQLAPQQVQAELGDADAQSVIDLSFDLLEDLMNNTSRGQLGLEVASEDIITHLRFVPRPGSTLEELTAARLPRVEVTDSRTR